MNKLTKKDIFVQKLKNRPIFVHGKDTNAITDEDIALLLECDIIQMERFPYQKGKGPLIYRALHCIHLTHEHRSPAGFWLCSTKIMKPGTWF